MRTKRTAVDETTSLAFLPGLAYARELLRTEYVNADATLASQIQLIRRRAGLGVPIAGASEAPEAIAPKGKRIMSARGRANISAAQKARWSRQKAEATTKIRRGNRQAKKMREAKAAKAKAAAAVGR